MKPAEPSPATSIHWEANIPAGELLRDAGKILLLAFGIMFVIVEIIAQAVDESFFAAIYTGIVKRDPYLGYAAGFVGFWLLLSAVFVWAIYRGGYEAAFGVEPRGVWMQTRPATRRINRRLNILLLVLGILARRPGAVGTAMLAESSQSGSAAWRDVRTVAADPEKRMISLKSSWRTLIKLYCTPENFDDVLALTKLYAEGQNKKREKKD